MKCLRGAGLGVRNIQLDFVADLRSRNIISSLPICNMYNSNNSLLFTRCQHYNADDFGDEPDLNTVHQFNTANYNEFLGRSLNSMSAL